jgi:hypothetical protein
MTLRILTSLVTAACLMVSIDSRATQQWTACETVIGVNNYIPGSKAIIVALSPAVPGCASAVNGVSGSVTFDAGVNGVLATDLSPLLASILTAYTTGKQVMLYYDNAAGCYGQLVANGGYGGQCP